MAGGSPANAQGGDDLATLGTATWTLIELDGQMVPTAAGITADFGDDDTLSGSGGCNEYSGT